MVRSRTARNKKSSTTFSGGNVGKGFDRNGPDFRGGGGFEIPEGVYGMKLESLEQKESKSSGNEMFEWVFKGTTGKAKGKTFYYYTVLESEDPQKLGKALLAVGVEVDDDGNYDDFELDDVVDAECFGEVKSEEYNGSPRSKLVRIFAEAEGGEEVDDEEEEEKPARGRRARANGKATKKATKMSEDEITDCDEEELEDLISKHELEVDLSKAKTLSKKRNAVLEAMTEADLVA